MAARSKEIKVGILVLIGAVVVVAAIWIAKGYRLGASFYNVSVVFPDVGSLATGDAATVSGVNKGKVENIKLYKGEVLVTLELAKDVKLKKDATFTIRNLGLMGERFVAVTAGKSEEPLDLSKPAHGVMESGIPEVMGTLGSLVQAVSQLVTKLDQTIASPATLDKFSKTITSLQQLSARLDSVAEYNMPKIDRVVRNFDELSESVRNGVDRNEKQVDTIVQNVDVAAKRLVTLTQDLEEASTRFKTFASDLNNSKGSLQLFMNDPRLYDDLRRTAQNIDSLVVDIRKNPRKYISFSVELF
jgi:phospholipid/cholesterol/gamma-HCH transport system substrate-binding protein